MLKITNISNLGAIKSLTKMLKLELCEENGTTKQENKTKNLYLIWNCLEASVLFFGIKIFAF